MRSPVQTTLKKRKTEHKTKTTRKRLKKSTQRASLSSHSPTRTLTRRVATIMCAWVPQLPSAFTSRLAWASLLIEASASSPRSHKSSERPIRTTRNRSGAERTMTETVPSQTRPTLTDATRRRATKNKRVRSKTSRRHQEALSSSQQLKWLSCATTLSTFRSQMKARQTTITATTTRSSSMTSRSRQKRRKEATHPVQRILNIRLMWACSTSLNSISSPKLSARSVGDRRNETMSHLANRVTSPLSARRSR